MNYSESDSGVPAMYVDISPTSGDDLAAKIADAIDPTGYWVKSGSGGDWYVTSVENPSSSGGYQTKVRLQNSGGNVSAGLYAPDNSWNLWSATKPYIAYVAAHVYRCFFSPYTCCVADMTAPLGTYSLLYFGVPKMPPRPAAIINDAALLGGHGDGGTWRQCHTLSTTQFVRNTTRAGNSRCVLGPLALYTYSPYGTITEPAPSFFDTPGVGFAEPFQCCIGTQFGGPPYYLMGDLYDMAVFYKPGGYAMDVIEEYDGHEWQCLTNLKNPSIFICRD